MKPFFPFRLLGSIRAKHDPTWWHVLSDEKRLSDWLQLIADVAYDRDGFHSAEDLGSLVDEIRLFALLALRGEEPNVFEPLVGQPTSPNVSCSKVNSTRRSIADVTRAIMNGPIRGSVKCPRCGGDLRYIHHPVTGIISAVCMTKGCLAWSLE